MLVVDTYMFYYSFDDNLWFKSFWFLFVAIVLTGTIVLVVRYFKNLRFDNVSLVELLIGFSKYALSRTKLGIYIFSGVMILSVTFVLTSLVYYCMKSRNLVVHEGRYDVYVGSTDSMSKKMIIADSYILVPLYHPEERRSDIALELFDSLCGVMEYLIQNKRVEYTNCIEKSSEILYCNLKFANIGDSVRDIITRKHLHFNLYKWHLVGFPIYKVQSATIKSHKNIVKLGIVDTLCSGIVEFYSCSFSIHKEEDIPFVQEKNFTMNFVPHCYVYYHINRSIIETIVKYLGCAIKRQ